jgi:hypothetical protein
LLETLHRKLQTSAADFGVSQKIALARHYRFVNRGKLTNGQCKIKARRASPAGSFKGEFF